MGLSGITRMMITNILSANHKIAMGEREAISAPSTFATNLKRLLTKPGSLQQ